MNRKTKTIVLLTAVLASAWIISQTLGGPTVPSDQSPTSVRETQDGPEETRLVRLEDEEHREREEMERRERQEVERPAARPARAPTPRRTARPTRNRRPAREMSREEAEYAEMARRAMEEERRFAEEMERRMRGERGMRGREREEMERRQRREREEAEYRERGQRERWERERRRRAGVPWRGLVHRPSAPGEAAERVEMMLGMVRQIERVCFEPTTAGLIAAGGLKDDVPRRPAEIIDDLEEQLARTKTLGLRNAIRLSLKDLYKVEGKREMVLKHLRAMLAENDAALREHKPQVKRRER